MTEMFAHGAFDFNMWIDAFEGKDVDWDLLFEKYNSGWWYNMVWYYSHPMSGVDHPICQFFEVLALKKYPDAKIILTVGMKQYNTTLLNDSRFVIVKSGTTASLQQYTLCQRTGQSAS